MSEQPQQPLSVQDAGRKGGKTTAQRHGKKHYEEIGRLGGNRLRELVRKGKEAESDNSSQDA